MEIQRDPLHPHAVQHYDERSITIDGIHMTHSVVIHRNGVISPWPASAPATLNEACIAPLLALHLDILLIGYAGPTLLNPSLIGLLSKARLGVECMSIGAACRTFNLLLNEGRSVALGVIF